MGSPNTKLVVATPAESRSTSVVEKCAGSATDAIAAPGGSIRCR